MSQTTELNFHFVQLQTIVAWETRKNSTVKTVTWASKGAVWVTNQQQGHTEFSMEAKNKVINKTQIHRYLKAIQAISTQTYKKRNKQNVKFLLIYANTDYTTSMCLQIINNNSQNKLWPTNL